MSDSEKVTYSKEELKKRLTPIQYHVTQEKGTERAFTGKYNKTTDAGVYSCIVCNEHLFSSDTKFDSGCGWPAFNDVLDQGKVKLTKDTSHEIPGQLVAFAVIALPFFFCFFDNIGLINRSKLYTDGNSFCRLLTNPNAVYMKKINMVSSEFKVGGNLLLLIANPGMVRTEVTCSKCGAHLGHVFNDGPKPTRKRFCINSASLNFYPPQLEELE